MKHIKIILNMLTSGLILLACETEKKADNNAESPVVNKLPVDVKVVRSTKIDHQETISGSVMANKEVVITSEVSRKVTGVYFKDGSFVKEGQLLYKLDDADIRARIKQNEAELSLAKLNEQRLSKLLSKEAVRQEEYDVASSVYMQLLAASELLQVELSKTSIKAPFSGFVGINRAETGALVYPGTELVKVQDQSKVKITFSIPEKYASVVKVGSRIEYTTSIQSDKRKAVISTIQPGIDITNRSILVQAIVDNPQNILKPGMSATVYYSSTGDNEYGMFVPTQSLIPGADGYAVFAVQKGKAVLKPVRISNRNETDALIVSGISNGDSVLTSNILRTSEGTPVLIVSAK